MDRFQSYGTSHYDLNHNLLSFAPYTAEYDLNTAPDKSMKPQQAGCD